MITPLGQRQIFQTANVEAVRVAHEVSGQMQREQVHRQIAEEKAAEENGNVQIIAGSDKIRTEERQGRRGSQQQSANEKQEEEDDEKENPSSGDQHLDFMA